MDAKVIDALPFRHTTDTSTATADPGDPSFSCFSGGVASGARSVWYAFTSSRAMTLEADTFDTYEAGEVFDTAIVAYRGAPAVPSCRSPATTTTSTT